MNSFNKVFGLTVGCVALALLIVMAIPAVHFSRLKSARSRASTIIREFPPERIKDAVHAFSTERMFLSGRFTNFIALEELAKGGYLTTDEVLKLQKLPATAVRVEHGPTNTEIVVLVTTAYERIAIGLRGEFYLLGPGD